VNGQNVLSGATKKLQSWRPQGIPLDEAERAAYRQLAVEAVYSIWNREGRPAQLSEICRLVRRKVKEKIAADEWPFRSYRSKRTIDRRVNEAASSQFSKDGVPKIVAVTSGVYQPNPTLFEKKADGAKLEFYQIKEESH